MAHQEDTTTNGTASMADQPATTGAAANLSIRPVAYQPASSANNAATSTGQATNFDVPMRSPPPPYLAEPQGSDISKVELTTGKPLYIRVVDVVRDTQSVVEQIIRNVSVMMPKLCPVKFANNPTPRYEVVAMEVAGPPGGYPMARYAVAADGEIVFEGPTYSHAKDALTWLLAETMRVVSKHAPRAWGEDEEGTSGPNARWAQE